MHVERTPLATEAEIEKARAVTFGDVEDYYPEEDDQEHRRTAWNETRAHWETLRNQACSAASSGDLEATLRAIVAMHQAELEYGDDPSTRDVIEALNLQVEGGDTAEDYDHGTVVAATSQNEVVVAWEHALVKTEIHLDLLRPYSRESANRFLVTIEEMPDHLRGSHRAARNWGTYPQNGATRRRVWPSEAEDIIEADPDSYAHVVAD